MKADILSMSAPELREFAKSLGESAFRGDQLFGWMMKGASFEQMKNLP